MEREEAKSLAIGLTYKKRCWDFGIKYSENNRPILTTSSSTGSSTSSSIYDKYIYVTIVLKPLMQSNSASFLTYQLPQE
jgi:LPS-assembly protein